MRIRNLFDPGSGIEKFGSGINILDPEHCPLVITFNPALEPGQPGGKFLDRVLLEDGQIQAEQTGVGRVVRHPQLNTLLSPAPNSNKVTALVCSVPDPNPDPDPPHPRVFLQPGSGSTSLRYGSGSRSFYHHAKIIRKILNPTIL